jgi:serine/threonine-protein kinase
VTLPERYEPLRRVARGGMGSVWCALDHTLDRQVAIKVLAERYAHDKLAGRRFTREARAAARLSGHPNVVTIYDVGRAMPSAESPQGRPFIVMEYLAGGTVADALRTGEFDQAMTLAWLHQAAAALDYAHSRGVIHRDVKLSNFLLDLERVLRVGDFGIAQVGTEDTLTMSGEVLGTAAYLAPERALGLPATDASDRYGLAVAAFELLVGERPFTAEPFTAQARQHVQEAPPPASERNTTLPPAVDAVLTGGMAKQPDDRFSSASEFVDAIDRALVTSAKRGARARLAGDPPPVVAYSSRRPRRIAALAAFAAVLLGLVIAAGATLIAVGGGPRSAARTHPLYAQHEVAGQAPAHAARDQSDTATASTIPGTSTTPVTQPRAAQPATAAVSLEAQGHQLMVGGDYHGAIPVLREAVAAAPRSSLTYAYALYDLGRSLRLGGDPRDAVSVLYRRLQIPNQTGVVRNELALALEALGQSQAGNTGAGSTGPGDGGNAPAGNGGTSSGGGAPSGSPGTSNGNAPAGNADGKKHGHGHAGKQGKASRGGPSGGGAISAPQGGPGDQQGGPMASVQAFPGQPGDNQGD